MCNTNLTLEYICLKLKDVSSYKIGSLELTNDDAEFSWIWPFTQHRKNRSINVTICF